MAQRNRRLPAPGIARWLTGLWDLSVPDGITPYNLLRRDQGGGANLSGATPIADLWGDGWTLGNGSYLDYLQLAADASLYIGTSEFTLLVEFRQTAAGSQANCAIFGAGDSATHMGQIYTAASNANLGYMIGWYAAPNFGSVANGNTIRQCAALTTGPRGTELWRNGVRIASASAMTRVVGGPLRLGQTYTGNTDYGRAGPTVFYAAACSKLQLPVDLLSALTADPGQLFARRPRAVVINLPSAGISKTVTDAAAGSDDVAQLAVAFGVSDSGAGLDALPGEAVQFALADAGAGADAIGSVIAGFTIVDAGSAVDAVPALAATFALLDTATGTDGLTVLASAVKLIADSGVGTDGLALAVDVALAETATGNDIVGAISVLLALADSGAGVEVVARLDPAARVVRLTFAFRRRRAAFAFARRTMQFKLAA